MKLLYVTMDGGRRKGTIAKVYFFIKTTNNFYFFYLAKLSKVVDSLLGRSRNVKIRKPTFLLRGRGENADSC